MSRRRGAARSNDPCDRLSLSDSGIPKSGNAYLERAQAFAPNRPGAGSGNFSIPGRKPLV